MLDPLLWWISYHIWKVFLCESQMETNFMLTFELIISGHYAQTQKGKYMFSLCVLRALAEGNCMNSSKLFSQIDQDNRNQFSPSSILRFYFFKSTFFFIFFHFSDQFCQEFQVLAIKSIRASEFLWKWELFKTSATIFNFSIYQKTLA